MPTDWPSLLRIEVDAFHSSDLRSGWGDVPNQVGFPISPGSEQVLEVPGDRKIRQLRISFIIPATQDIRI